MTTPHSPAPLLATKLYLPVPRASAVVRQRLVARLLGGLRGRLTLIAAPAGFGKSTLLAQALGTANRPRALAQIAWVSLDEGDNDATRFWSYVCTALERGSPGVGAPALALLRAAPDAAETALAELLNTLTDHPAQLALVLDDYHTITNGSIHEGVSFLIDHAPPQLRVVIASRIDPPLPLARWRARGELTEIRVNDLRFTGDEATLFFNETMGLPLDANAAAALEARTEGWAAGLQLAALSLQGLADVGSFITNFSGTHRHVVDYLLAEVLNRQPEAVRAFLLQTSILERMSAELCDAVVDDNGSRPSAAAILAELERQNLFLIPLDDERRWYRYHHLFADLLRHQLRQECPALVVELHRRAARWCEGQGVVAEAVEHALAANDAPLVARLLSAYGSRFAATGETHTLQRWLDTLPPEQLLNDPQLCLAQAQVLILNRQVLAIEPFVQAAEAVLVSAQGQEAVALRGELLSLRAHMAIERGRFADALTLARQAEALLPPSEQWAVSGNGLVLGYTLMVFGQTREAEAAHVENIERSRKVGNVVSALFSATEVVKLQALQGRLHAARASVEHALAWVRRQGWEQLPPTSALHTWRGNVLLEQGNVPAAEEAFAQAIRLTQHGPAITAARVQIFLARLCQLVSDSQRANAALARVEAICRDWQPGGERSFFMAHVARVRLLGGDVVAARLWASQQQVWRADEVPNYFREIELLTLARVALLGGAAPPDATACEQTSALLGWLRDHARAAGRGAVVIETLALEAIAKMQAGARAEAHQVLDEALTLAAPEGGVGLFLDLGAPLADLLQQNLAKRGATDPLRPFLHALSLGQPTPAPPPTQPRLAPAALGAGAALTEREREVLRLYVAGLTSAQIAAHFVVSINTVKTQLKSIYSKLDTHSRAEVVARARALGLVS